MNYGNYIGIIYFNLKVLVTVNSGQELVLSECGIFPESETSLEMLTGRKSV